MMPPEEISVGLHRRRDDYVTYRDMVEFYAEHSSHDATVRAESLMMINRALEKLEMKSDKVFASLESKLDEHEKWHRDYLEKFIDSSKSNRVAVWAVVVSIVAVIVTLVIGIVTVIHH